MDLIDKKITHKVFGQGHVTEQNATVITVAFADDTKRFVYPDAFNNFITLDDKEAAKSLDKVILKKEKKREAEEIERQAEMEQLELERQRREMLKNHRIHESSQIVFWLDEEEQEDVFTSWQAFTGTVQSGKSEGQPNKAVRLRPNSAALLTRRAADDEETERRIIGLYMVEETFAGDLSEDGIVPAHEAYRIELTEDEIEKMPFWKFYLNKSYPTRTTWNSGKYRYFDNVWTAQILKAIIGLRTDETLSKEANEFLEYFCQMNALDINNIPDANGALRQ